MVVSNCTTNFGLLFQKWSLGTQESFCKVWDQLDTRLNNYGLISSQSMLTYHLMLKSAVSWETAARIAYHLMLISAVSQILSDDFRHGGVKFNKKNNFGLLFQKWSLGTQESFCKVSDQLYTRLNNYGLISRHTSSKLCQ